jgi:serine/threonine protein kinase
MIGNYIAEEVLIQGLFSSLILARRNSEKFLIKTFWNRAVKEYDEALIAAFNHEIQSYLKFEHPFIAKVHEIVKDPLIGSSFVFENCDKWTLFNEISARGRLEENLCCTLFTQFISALKECQAKNVVHRNIKPENLIFDSNYNLQLAGFSLSAGTAGYRAPETNRSEFRDIGSDIFSAGVVLFIMYAGVPPFTFTNSSDWWFNQLLEKSYDLFWRSHDKNVKFSSELKDLIIRMLEIDPRKRISISEIELHPWIRKCSLLNSSEIIQNMQMRQNQKK